MNVMITPVCHLPYMNMVTQKEAVAG